MEKQKTIYALGFFDGVHRGHQALLRAAREEANRAGCRAGAVTFDIPPAAFLRGTPPEMITTLPDRLALLRRFGMDTVEVLPCNAESLATPWLAFLEKLVEKGAAGFVCGHDFRFGYRGEGNAETLQSFCRARNFPCTVVPEQTLDGVRISSTAIRCLLEQGEMEKANALLGHPHILSGTVVPGHQLGRTLGLPTANLLLPQELLTPAFGVYCTKATVDGKTYSAVTNIGVRPTVSGSGVTVESWILDFGGDLYGKNLTLEFYKFLRPERKFDSLSDLQQEIQRNGEETRKFFGKN